MFSNGDARDVGGLEEVFRSDEFGRATDAMGGGVSDPVDREDVIFAREFGRLLTSVRWDDVEGEAEPRLSPIGGGPQGARVDENEVSERPLQVAPSAAGAALGAEHVETPSTAPSKRHATRSGTIAVCQRARCARGRGDHGRGWVTIRGRMSRRKDSTTRRVRTGGPTPPVRRQRARRLRAERSRPQPGPVACHRARVRAGGSVRATSQGDT